MTTISRFTGEHAYLSNFFPAATTLNGVMYATAEHYYQAMKAATPDGFSTILRAPTPGEAKKRGQRVVMRQDFESRKRTIMMTGVLAKFDQHPELRARLANTGTAFLVEGNSWRDQYWGAVQQPQDALSPEAAVWAPSEADASSEWYVGDNWLGRILMMVREVTR